jgi:hypothetical protein
MSRNFEQGPAFLENPAHTLWWEEFLNTRSSNRKTVRYNLLRGCLTNNWPPFTSHTVETTPLSEICLLRIQGYSWPCSKLRDICYKLVTAFGWGAYMSWTSRKRLYAGNMNRWSNLPAKFFVNIQLWLGTERSSALRASVQYVLALAFRSRLLWRPLLEAGCPMDPAVVSVFCSSPHVKTWFHARLPSWRPCVIQVKFWNTYMILADFCWGFALFQTLHTKSNILLIFLHPTISNSHNVWSHRTFESGE